jgi:acetyl-CoA carboxylase biotin carboxyl carrier protein
MEVKQINQLMIAMGRYGIKKLSLKKEGEEISLEREERTSGRFIEAPDISEENPLRGDFEKHRVSSTLKQDQEKRESPLKEEENALFISSPMVGTFYRASSPTDAPFAKPGDHVEEQTVVCLIEAMKVMNEVKAGVRGTISEVFIENAQPVEFGAKLFRVTP